MRALLVPLLVLLAGMGSGCLLPEKSEPAEPWRFDGRFAHGYTQADVRAVCDAGAGPGKTCEMGMSEPPVFGFRFTSRAACEEARAKVAVVPRTRDVTPCLPEASR